MTSADSSSPEPPQWGLIPSLRNGVRELFPTRRTRAAMWGVVGLGVLITYLELLAVRFFSSLIGDLGDQSLTMSAITLGGFLLTFAAIKGVGYFQSVYRLTVFEKSLRKIVSTSRAAESWRWPLAIDMVGMLQQIFRLAIVVFTVTMASWEFGALLLLCTIVAMLIVNRTGRQQFVVHHEFAAAKKAGTPPSAAERISTRIRAGERAGLIAVVPVLVYIGALGVWAALGRVSVQNALVLFIAGRMAASMYGNLASSTMRFIRAQVNVEAYSGSPTAGPATTVNGSGPTLSDGEILARVAAGDYLLDAPSQAYVRLIDDGVYLGDLQTLGRLAREQGFGPDVGLRRRGKPSRPDRVIAVRPNQTWWVETFLVPGAQEQLHLQIVLDIYSRCLLHWRVCDTQSAHHTDRVLDEAAAKEGVAIADIDVVSPRMLPQQTPTVHDMLKFLGVVRTLVWRGSKAPGQPTSPVRPAFPTTFDSAAAAGAWMTVFTAWHNGVYYQPDVGYLHPRDVHAGLSDVITARRRDNLDAVFSPELNPFPQGFPATWTPPEEAWVEPMGITTISREPSTALDADMMEDDDDEL